MEKYSRGRRGAPAKGVGRATGARVQIPPSPPNERDNITVSSVITLFYAVFRTSYPDFEKAEFLYCQAFI